MSAGRRDDIHTVHNCRRHAVRWTRLHPSRSALESRAPSGGRHRRQGSCHRPATTNFEPSAAAARARERLAGPGLSGLAATVRSSVRRRRHSAVHCHCQTAWPVTTSLVTAAVTVSPRPCASLCTHGRRSPGQCPGPAAARRKKDSTILKEPRRVPAPPGTPEPCRSGTQRCT